MGQFDELLGPAATKVFEGFRSNIYKDTRGNPTIGYGFNLNDKVTASLIAPEVRLGKRPITQQEADVVFAGRYTIAVQDALQYIGPDVFTTLNPKQQTILVDMAYNLGLPKLNGFVELKKAILAGDDVKAAAEIKDSKFYKQTGRRAKHHVAFFGRQ